jgi:hypothetical protein
MEGIERQSAKDVPVFVDTYNVFVVDTSWYNPVPDNAIRDKFDVGRLIGVTIVKFLP